jgi:hypothetical protein
MATVKTKKGRTARKTDRVGEMNLDELRGLIRAIVGEMLAEMTQSDEGLEFTDDMARYLEEFRQGHPRGTPMEDVFNDIGIHD